jgi:hypothetical protein
VVSNQCPSFDTEVLVEQRAMQALNDALSGYVFCGALLVRRDLWMQIMVSISGTWGIGQAADRHSAASPAHYMTAPCDFTGCAVGVDE